MGAIDNQPVTQQTMENLRSSIQQEMVGIGASIRAAVSELQQHIVNNQQSIQQLQQLVQQPIPQGTFQTVPQPVQQPTQRPAQQLDQSATGMPVERETPAAPRIPTINTCKDADNQWDFGEVEKGLDIPLSGWTKEMKATDPSRYSQRRLIVEEYIHFGRNGGNMRDCHGGSLETISDLITSIRVKNRERKEQRALLLWAILTSVLLASKPEIFGAVSNYTPKICLQSSISALPAFWADSVSSQPLMVPTDSRSASMAILVGSKSGIVLPTSIQLIHAVILLAISQSPAAMSRALIGIALFSGSIYDLILDTNKTYSRALKLEPVTSWMIEPGSWKVRPDIF
ncbi:hypothetical protein BGZ65_000446 [Modicella reniformis]|uniref:Uncharacterized protein n=1 Tax=Modicella reniformis TaxID=1440133 RepID=A0A9P6MA57_9FUNG|nr:hypothetical protein BGZ65_000446 [Modicella reniformis]